MITMKTMMAVVLLALSGCATDQVYEDYKWDQLQARLHAIDNYYNALEQTAHTAQDVHAIREQLEAR